MKGLFAFLAMTLIIPCTFAQNPPNWSVAATDYYKTGVMMSVDNENNALIVGDRSAFVGDASIYTRKFDIAGNLLWERKDSTNVPQNYERASWVNTDLQNNVYVIGFRYVGTSVDYTNALVVLKYNSDGDLQWKLDIAHPWPSGLSMRSELDEEGNLYIGTVGLDIGFNLLKIDPNGNEVFNVSDASTGNQDFTSMRLRGNTVALCGYGANGTIACLAVFNTAGDYLWSDQFDTRSGIDVEIDNEGIFYLLSRKENQVSATSGMDLKVLKIDNTGAIVDEFNYDFGLSTEFGNRMILANNKISISGLSIPNGEAYMDWQILQIDLNGNQIWEASYDLLTSNDERNYWITARDNGEVYVCGQGGPEYVDFNGTAYMQYVVAKFSSTGELLWSDTNMYQGYVGVTCALDGDCGLYVLGQSAMTLSHYEDDCEVDAIDETRTQVSQSVLITPNPTEGEIRIHIPDGAVIEEILVYDASGHMMQQCRLTTRQNPGDIQFNLTSLPAGIYQLAILSARGTYTTRVLRK